MKPKQSLLLVGLCSLALLAVACTPGPAETPGPGVTPGPDTDAATGVLCDPAQPASLDTIATGIEQEDVDVAQLSAVIDTALANIRGAQVDAMAEPARDDAVTALEDLQANIDDPDARDQAQTDAASAVRDLETQICP
jgi:hypothetical protein